MGYIGLATASAADNVQAVPYEIMNRSITGKCTVRSETGPSARLFDLVFDLVWSSFWCSNVQSVPVRGSLSYLWYV